MDKLSVILLLLCLSVGVVHSIGTFLAEVPEQIVSNKNTTIRIFLKDIDPPATYYISLSVKRHQICEAEGDMPPSRRALVTLQVPPWEPTVAILSITVHVAKFPDFLSEEKKNITIVDRKIDVFLTVKPDIYAPGERVKIKLVVVEDRKRVQATFPKVWITNPLRNEVKKWTDWYVPGSKEWDYLLPSNAELGNWTVTVQVHRNLNIFKSAPFRVVRVIKPNFRVIIYPPPYVLADQTSTNWTVCVRREDRSFPQGKLVLTLSTDKGIPGTEVVKNVELDAMTGCYILEYEGAIFNIDTWYEIPKHVILKANFTEDETGAKEGAMSKTIIFNEAVKLKFRKKAHERFKLGLPSFETLEVRFPDDTFAPNQNIRLCLITLRNRQDTPDAAECDSFKSDENGLLVFLVPPQLQTTRILHIHAAATDYLNKTKEVNNTHIIIMKQPTAKTKLRVSETPSGNYLVVTQKGEHIECNQVFGFTVLYTLRDIGRDGVHFEYTIYHGQNVLQEGSTVDFPSNRSLFDYSLHNVLDRKALEYHTKPIYTFKLYVNITSNMAVESDIEVTTTREAHELVLDVAKFYVQPCLPNRVRTMFIADDRTPGSIVKYQVQADPGSLCELSFIEKSPYPMQPNMIDIDELYKETETKYITMGGTVTSPDCDRPNKDTRKNTTDNSEIYWPFMNRRKRWTEEDDDKLCSVESSIDYDEEKPVEPPKIQYFSEDINTDTTIKLFPQKVWLSDKLEIGDTGVATVEHRLPESVTDWNGYTICSSSSGLGVAPPASISAFQSFVFNYDLPYSVKVDEKMSVKVQLHNLEQHNIPVKIEIVKIPEIKVLSALSQSFCVGLLGSAVAVFTLKPQTSGTVNITIISSMDLENRASCTTAKPKTLRDDVVKQLVIVSEGLPVEKTRTSLICPDDQSREPSINWNVTLPMNRIPNTERVYMNVVPDLVGLTSENMNKLLPVPKDCGEQNMLPIATSFLVLKYMDAFKMMNSEIREQTIWNLENGYQMQFAFKLSDGSYAPFVYEESSMWLSAYVMKWLAKVEKYTYVNEKDLQATTNWIVSNQLDNGCFPLLGSVVRKEMKNGLQSDNSSPALTAYVLLSLLESGVSVPEHVINKAASCLENKMAHLDNDLYATVLTTYAFALHKHAKVHELMRKLMDTASHGNFGQQYWNNTNNPSWTLSVEMTCYVVLALIKLGGEKNLNDASKSVHWIVTQKNSMGGFVTTQDTTVCLQALTEYAIVSNNRRMDLTIRHSAREVNEVLSLREADRMSFSQIRLPVLPTTVQAVVSNSGCAIIQLETKYNIAFESTKTDIFDFSVSVKSEDDSRKCKKLNIKICARYKLPDHESNVALLEVGLLSGYELDWYSLELLLSSSSRVKHVGDNNDFAYLFFDKLTHEEECISFKIIRKTLVNHLKPANVKVFDYYQPTHIAFSTYQLPSTCTKDLLDLTSK